MSGLIPLDAVGEINDIARDLKRLRLFISHYDPANGCSANAVVNLSVGYGEGSYKLAIDDPVAVLRARERTLEARLRGLGIEPGPSAEAEMLPQPIQTKGGRGASE